MIGLGCMRLSTRPDRDTLDPERVIRTALDAGARLLDTADVYCHNQNDIGHNERLIAKALARWQGDRSAIQIATKGGLTRPGGNWVPDGRARHLARACEASLRALDLSIIDLYQLHVVDPRTPLETSVRALATLERRGLIRHSGLSNVTVGQIVAARRIADITAVQVSLGPFDEENFRNGVAEYCRDHGIRLLAYRPLGGREGVTRIAKDPELAELAAGHGATAHEIVLAWLLDLAACVVPIPGATRTETAASVGKAPEIRLTNEDRAMLDRRFPAGRLLREPRSVRRAAVRTDGEVVLVMGMPAAGKSTLAREFEAEGYERLNRDSRGGSLADLIPALGRGLAEGRRRWVLDNTYASRSARNRVIECAWDAGVKVRCVWLRTGLADAQINAIARMIDLLGRLPTPEEIRALGRSDHRFFGPDAQFRYERALEPPVLEEGFAAVEERAWSTRDRGGSGRAVMLDLDVLGSSAGGVAPVLDPADLLVPAGRREVLARYQAEGWKLFVHAWRPQVSRGELPPDRVERIFTRLRELTGLDLVTASCPHDAGPPVCWCRKPLPGLVLEFARRHDIRINQSLVVGGAAADQTMARRLGATHAAPELVFAR